MAYGKIYISNLRQKVNGLFSDLRKENKLNEKEFIGAFKEK